MTTQLNGRRAIVTGGASNIGRGITLALARQGCNVAIFDIDDDQMEIVAQESPHLISTHSVDLLRDDAVEAAVREVTEAAGLDILVNNAGFAKPELFVDKSSASIESEITMNLIAPLKLTRLVARHMSERRSGRIITIASDAAKVGEYKEVAYSAAKAGLLGMTKSLAREIGKYGVTVNAICPGMTVPADAAHVGERSMQRDRDRPPELINKIVKNYPMRRLGDPEDIAEAVLYLASDGASFVTGQAISVSGGFTMC